jgi:uncharacterized membrane protein YjfL (UPF0719 family)
MNHLALQLADITSHIQPGQILATAVYSAIGIVFFALAFIIFVKVTPFSITKEIEEDQNTALGIIMGSIFIGLSIIIAAAII